MAIDQNGLNSLLATLTPQNNMAALREQRANLLQKLQQRTDAGKTDGAQQQAGDIKHDIQELAAVDQKINQEMYDEIASKLEEERLEREAAFAKNERDRERALAKHERLLENRSMSKLLSAAGKASHPGAACIGGSQGDKNYVSDVERDLQESVQYGIAAAEVATRRKNAEAKAQIEESAEKHQAAHRRKTKRVNIMV